MTFRPSNNSHSTTVDPDALELSLRRGRSLHSFAEHLLSQQLWCWGQDIMRTEGNWLLELGFQRERPPVERKKCPSVYTLHLPQDRCVVLRGFGIFWGDPQIGGVFLRRYEFKPLYSQAAKLECPPWSQADMPEFSATGGLSDTARQRLLLDLLVWIGRYEEQVAEELGVAYRQAILQKWDNGRRPIVPAEEIVVAWQHVAHTFCSHLASNGSAA